MTEGAFAVVALLVLAWAVTSELLARANIDGPLLFAVAGFLLANPDWGPLAVDFEAPSIHVIAEVTLALLLFADASRVDASKLLHDLGVPTRLLGIGLPLSVILGSLFAAWIFGDLSWALAGFVGATLAPTDAALSAQVINDERIPKRVRRVLNVESGLNDGIVTPIVTFCLAVAASQLGVGEDAGGGRALLELALGIGVGIALGVGTAGLIILGSRRDWISVGGRRIATLGGALGSFALASALHGNGFIAAFVAGVVFAATLGLEGAEVDVDEIAELPEFVGEVLALVVWFLFGAVLVPVAVNNLALSVVVYAVLSLTVIRMVPVALSLVGTGLDRPTVLFIGWFGPRGLASVVFALLAVEELGETADVVPAIAAVALTVSLSVVLHGVSAGPLGKRYAALEDVDA